MRVIFMGSPAFAVAVLDALVGAGHDICAVYTQPPRPAGRGKKPQPTATHRRAQALGLPVRHPVSLREGTQQRAFAALNADVAVVAAYGLILPPGILHAPPWGCLNVHPSLLPRWRGAAPIARALMAGDKTTGLCIMQMEQGLDTGPILLRRHVAIDAKETAGGLHDRLAKCGGAAMVEALARLPDLTPMPQEDTGITYAAKISRAETEIDWNDSATEVDCKIRGLSPSPGAWSHINGQRLKFLDSRVVCRRGRHSAPGRLLNAPLQIACATGVVEILRLQRPGKTAQQACEFLRGAALAQGAQLGAPKGFGAP
ncbi:MAG: methionyl-tRNA formyltransferase [Rhodobacteraceae bacterium]|nr:methionyl-tRNA formyltransferase [Paracoccaceae bacterium]